MPYIIVGRKKGTKEEFKNLGPYVYAQKSQFGSLKRIRKDNPNWEIKIVSQRPKIKAKVKM